MTHLPNFSLAQSGKVSSLFIAHGATHYYDAVGYLKELPYRRLDNPRDLSSVFAQQGGTFTARHALLVQLAREQGVMDLSLTLCVYELNEEDCPEVSQTLRHYGLSTLPEICGCLKYRQQLYTLAEDNLCLRREVVSEVEIAPAQIGNFKKRYHQNYLENWLQLEKLDQKWSVEEVWNIREECLHVLTSHWNDGCRQPLAA